jgi:glycosyltransferase involved in cell wall biosynthesis
VPETELENIVRPVQDVLFVDSLLLDTLEPKDLDFIRRARSFFLLHYLPSFGDDALEKLSVREREVLACFNGIVTTSVYSRQRVETSLESVPVVAIEPGVTEPERLSVRALPGLRALMVANLTRNKGVLPFLQHLADQWEDGDSFVLSIVGRHDMEPDYAASCRRCIEESSLSSSVMLIGSVPHRDIHSWYAGHNLFISASAFETFGMAIQEARSFGLPLLVLDRGYAGRHVVQGENGYVYDSISMLVKGFLDLTKDTDRFNRLQEAGCRAASRANHTWKDAAEAAIRFVMMNGEF